MAGLFIRFMVEKCAACQNHPKSNFGWSNMCNWSHADSVLNSSSLLLGEKLIK